MRKALIILLCCTAALFAAYASFRGYKVWKQNHMISLARGFIAKRDARNALLSVQQALQANPVNVEATRLMADLMQAANSPSVLLWRGRVVQLDPASTDDRLALAVAAIAVRDFISATNALDGVIETAKKTSAYHNIAGSVDAARGQLVEAEAHFSEAIRLEPTNAFLRLNLAMIQLKGTNAQNAAEARSVLRQLSNLPAVRHQALRELVLDAMRNKRADEALQMSADLLRTTNSVFQDRLLRLEVLDGTRNQEFKTTLALYQQEAANDSAEIDALARWQLSRGNPADTLNWLRTLPITLQTNQPVALLQAECRDSLKNWRALQASLAQQNWGELEFIRQAFMARAFRGQDLKDSARTEWEQALKAANPQKQTLLMLFTLAAKWNWQSEAEDLLWTIVNRYPEERWAAQALSKAFFVSGRTRSLLRLCNQQLKRSPADLSVQNNLAITALLLDAQELKPHDLARDVYEKAPTNSSFASTYAFSLHLQSKNAEALKVMEQLPPKDLEKPTIAGYYGLVLKATGNTAKAKAYLGWASKAQLLPEEKKLFDKARAGV